MLNQREAVSFLLQRNLLDTKHIVDHNLSVASTSRRHHSYKIATGTKTGFILKQGVGPDKVKSIEREAAVYKFLASQVGELRPFVPSCFDYDASEHILVLELVGDGQSLRDYHAQRGYFSISLARTLGKALATLHGYPARNEGLRKEYHQTNHISDQHPWVFELHRPKFKFVQDCSNANVQLIRTIQQFPEYCAQLEKIRKEWRVGAFVHNDMRWDNCIVCAKASSARKTRIKIIDWEIAGLGDPCWDVGSVINDYISFWLLSIPVSQDMAPDQLLALARHPLEKMQPALRSFWGNYVHKMGMDAETEERNLLRSIQFAAVRLLQTAFEQMQSSVRLTGNMVFMLQLSSNILQRPKEATVQLLGIPVQEARLP